MAQEHHIRLLARQLPRRLPNLTLLRQNPDPPLPQILHKPSVIDIHSLILAPFQSRAPSESARLPIARRDGLPDVAFKHGEAEGAEVEDVAFLELGAGSGWRYRSAVGVVGLPLGDVVELGPDLGGGYSMRYHFVGGEVVCCARLVALGPDDAGLFGLVCERCVHVLR